MAEKRALRKDWADLQQKGYPKEYMKDKKESGKN